MHIQLLLSRLKKHVWQQLKIGPCIFKIAVKNFAKVFNSLKFAKPVCCNFECTNIYDMQIKHTLICLLCSTVFLTACKKSSSDCKLQVSLHDNPAAYEEVNVDIKDVELYSNENGWEALTTNRGIYDLLKLQGDSDTVIVTSQNFTAIKLQQLRLILGTNNTVKISGIVYPLALNSQDETGLKINLNKQLSPAQTYVIDVDFDAAQSIIDNGNGTYRLKPVLKAEIN